MIPGVDLSDNNGPTDNPTLAKYLLDQSPDAFAIVKVSEGTNYVSTTLDQQRMGLHAAALKWIGLYHFGRPSASTGHDEAQFFLKTIGDHGGILKGEFLCLDLEDDRVAPNADLQAYVDDFCGVIERALGIKVVVYSAPYYTVPHRVVIDWRDYWLADPSGSLNNTLCAIRQYNWAGKVPGVNTDCDLDRLATSISEFTTRHCWGFQPDPVAGKPATGTPDQPASTDAETTVKHAIELLRAADYEPTGNVDTAIADLSQWLTHQGLLP